MRARKTSRNGGRPLTFGTPSSPRATSAQRIQQAHNVANVSRRLVGLAAAAAHADVSTRTLRRYISQGRLTGYRVGPRLIQIDLNEIDSLATPIPNRNG
jgi:predicted DNA-binding transcriptional regulator YafY